MTLGAIGLFYILLLLTDTSIAEASAQGWLLEPFSEARLWQPLSFSVLTQVNWSAIGSQSSCMATVIVTSAISLLLTASGLELVAEREINLNRELQVAGAANIVVGLSGGIVGYHALGDTVLAYKMGGRNRLSALVAAGVFIAALVLGSSLLAYFPKPVLGGLLLFLGLSLLVEWVYDAWFKLSKADYSIVLLVLIVSGAVGFLLS